MKKNGPTPLTDQSRTLRLEMRALVHQRGAIARKFRAAAAPSRERRSARLHAEPLGNSASSDTTQNAPQRTMAANVNG